MLLNTVSVGMTVGAALGHAIAVITHTNDAATTAIGTIAGAVVGTAIAAKEAEKDRA